MLFNTKRINRINYGLMALVVAAGLIFSTFITSRAFAAGQLLKRSIKMSSANASATSQTYQVSFQVPSSVTVKGIIVDICDSASTPIIGLGCSAPSGFTWGTTTGFSAMLNASAVDPVPSGGTNDTANWTVSAVNSGRTLQMINATGSAMTAGATSWFTVTVPTVTNTSTVGTFYGRILTYADNDDDGDGCSNADDNPGCYAPTTERTYIDAGGIALSTVNLLTVTAKVQEQLTFCIYTSSPGSNYCATGTGNSINVPTSATTPLSTTAVQTDASAKFAISTNALNGAIVRMKGFDPTNTANTRATIMSGSNSIAAFGTTCTADSTTNTVEQFGMRLSAVGAGLTGAVPYNCSAGNHGWDTATANDNLTATYGDTVASLAAPTGEVQSTMEFAAKSALTTPAGIYTIGLSFIATGSY